MHFYVKKVVTNKEESCILYKNRLPLLWEVNAKKGRLDMRKKILSAALALIMLLALVPTAVFAATAEPNVTVSKTATEVEGMVNAWDVELKVTAKPDTTAGSANDVVLVIDNSNSMYQKTIPTGEIEWDWWWPTEVMIDRMTIAKMAAEKFIDQILVEGGNSRVAIVVFGSGIAATKGFTNNKADLKEFIENISQDYNNGGTNIQTGINKAADLLSNSTNHKNIVLLADGEPTYYYDGNELKGKGDKCDEATKQATIAAAAAAKEENTLYTVAFDAGKLGTEIMKTCATSSKTAFAVNEEKDVAKLTNVFSEIAGSITTSCKNASVTDVMGDGFVVVGDVSTDNGTAVVSEDGKTINWTIGDVVEAEVDQDGKPTGNYVATLTYTVNLDEGIYEAVPNENGLYAVNKSAVLSYNNGAEEVFEVPEVYVTALYMAKLLANEEKGIFDVVVTNENTGEEWGTASLNAIAVTEDMTEEQLLAAVAENMLVIMETVPAGSYVAEEIVDAADYNVAYYVMNPSALENNDGNLMESNTFSMVNGEDVVVIVANEKILSVPEVVNIYVTKFWKGDTEADRPESITVNVLADGKVVESMELTAADNWAGSLLDMPAYANGKAIVYTVEEKAVEGYTAAYSTDANGGLIITNTLVPAPTVDPGSNVDPEPAPAPQTGDSSNMVLYIVLAVMAMAGVCAMVFVPKKHGKRSA